MVLHQSLIRHGLFQNLAVWPGVIFILIVSLQTEPHGWKSQRIFVFTFYTFTIYTTLLLHQEVELSIFFFMWRWQTWCGGKLYMYNFISWSRWPERFVIIKASRKWKSSLSLLISLLGQLLSFVSCGGVELLLVVPWTLWAVVLSSQAMTSVFSCILTCCSL